MKIIEGVDVLAVHEHEDAGSTTVIARIAALGIAYSPRLAWRAGSAVRAVWERRHGELPPKANTRKRNGRGNHCHARYPLAMTAEIDAIIRETAGCAPTQPSLPLGEGTK